MRGCRRVWGAGVIAKRDIVNREAFRTDVGVNRSASQSRVAGNYDAIAGDGIENNLLLNGIEVHGKHGVTNVRKASGDLRRYIHVFNDGAGKKIVLEAKV